MSTEGTNYINNNLPNLSPEYHNILINSNRVYRFTVLFLVGLIIYIIALRSNTNPSRLIWSDMEGYYIYLPAVFINGSFKNVIPRDTAYLNNWPNTNKIFTKYTSGVAILEAPFFLTAHLISKLKKNESDGHNMVYYRGLMVAGVFYAVMGLYFLWLILIKKFNHAITLLVLGGLFFGTNLYYYTIFQPAMSHVYSFTMFSILIWVTEKIIIKETYSSTYIKSYSALLGLLIGLMVLIRPTNIIVMLYPAYLFYKLGVFDKISRKKVMISLFLFSILFIGVWIPQMVYWKMVTGKFFIWSYGEESFKYWMEPKLLKVLIDPWNGWLLYNPMVILPVMGIFSKGPLFKYQLKISGIILIICTYIFASWWAWWFGGAFGHRCYVDYLPLLAIPFAQFIKHNYKISFISILLCGVYLLFIYYNIGLTYNYEAPWDGPNWTYNSVWNEIKKLF